jgi:hypothetical protein
MKHETTETVKQIGDGLSAFTAAATLMQWLPAIAALFTIIWTAMRIIEMVTGKEFSVLIGLKAESGNAERE